MSNTYDTHPHDHAPADDGGFGAPPPGVAAGPSLDLLPEHRNEPTAADLAAERAKHERRARREAEERARIQAELHESFARDLEAATKSMLHEARTNIATACFIERLKNRTPNQPAAETRKVAAAEAIKDADALLEALGVGREPA